MTLDELYEIADRYGASVTVNTTVRVIRPQRRWKYGTHSIYNPRKGYAKGKLPTEKTW